MRTRQLGKTGFEVSDVGFGAWAIGGDWGTVDEAGAMKALHAAVDAGVTFFDTADVYGDGRSERLVARLRRERAEPLVVATKMGRRLPQEVGNYSAAHFAEWAERSRENLDVERLDLVQLHCPPTDLYYHPEIFDALDGLVDRGVVAHYGVSVERVEEGLKALDFDGVSTVQIIFNMFRQRPAARFLAAAAHARVGVIVRVPLASGLLSGKLSASTEFAEDDHRRFNRHGELFDVGETFAGVPYEVGLEAVERLRPLVPPGATLAHFALRWILDHPEVSVVIPGAKDEAQARANAAAADADPLDDEANGQVRSIYWDLVAPHVHERW